MYLAKPHDDNVDIWTQQTNQYGQGSVFGDLGFEFEVYWNKIADTFNHSQNVYFQIYFLLFWEKNKISWSCHCIKHTDDRCSTGAFCTVSRLIKDRLLFFHLYFLGSVMRTIFETAIFRFVKGGAAKFSHFQTSIFLIFFSCSKRLLFRALCPWGKVHGSTAFELRDLFISKAKSCNYGKQEKNNS